MGRERRVHQSSALAASISRPRLRRHLIGLESQLMGLISCSSHNISEYADYQCRMSALALELALELASALALELASALALAPTLALTLELASGLALELASALALELASALALELALLIFLPILRLF